MKIYVYILYQGYNKIQKTLPKTKEEYMGIIIDCFNSAAERDIYTGTLFNDKSFELC